MSAGKTGLPPLKVQASMVRLKSRLLIVMLSRTAPPKCRILFPLCCVHCHFAPGFAA